ncbi:MAG: hypothetical protein CMH56_13320 [Myxococcales bacterium]|nr:hypothetical protein [Myxococcales bacterium]
MMTVFRFVCFSTVLAFAGCHTTQSKPPADLKAATPVAVPPKPNDPLMYKAVLEASGSFQCFPEGTLKEEGKPLTCEPSGALLMGDSVMVASDKSTVGEDISPVFRLSLNETHPQPVPEAYALEPIFKTTRKIEDLTNSVDGHWSFATTGFDRYREDKVSWDAFNTLLYWPSNQPGAASIANPSERDGTISSVSLRASIQKAMSGEGAAGPAYFKVEGLVALPNNTLLFGVRERGASFKDFRYTLTLLKTTYMVEDGLVKLNEDFAEAYRFQPDEIEGLPKATGLSSITYDPNLDRLVLLTSYETAANHLDIGCFLWSLPIKDLAAGTPPQIIKDDKGQPFTIPHKGEAVIMIDANHLLIFHDDDRVTRTLEDSALRPGAHARAIHEGVWSLVGLR